MRTKPGPIIHWMRLRRGGCESIRAKGCCRPFDTAASHGSSATRTTRSTQHPRQTMPQSLRGVARCYPRSELVSAPHSWPSTFEERPAIGEPCLQSPRFSPTAHDARDHVSSLKPSRSAARLQRSAKERVGNTHTTQVPKVATVS